MGERGTCECDQSKHERLKRDPLIFKAIVCGAAFQDDGDGGRLAMRTCPHGCGSTLAMHEDVIELAWRLRAAHWAMSNGDTVGAMDEVARARELALRIEARQDRDDFERRQAQEAA